MSEFTKVPTQFPSKTAYNPKMVLMHMDTIKDICKELQEKIVNLEERLSNLEATKKIKKEQTS